MPGKPRQSLATKFDLETLLPSQAIFTFAPTWLAADFGGYGSGKTVALCTRMLYWMSKVSHNRGALLRLNATDLRTSTIPVWEEVCPESWVKGRVRTKGDEHDVLRNNSVVLFRHIRDARPGKRHLASLNVAHIGIEESQEVDEDDFIHLQSRIRYRKELYHSLSMVGTPAGHDWRWRWFIQQAQTTRSHPIAELKNFDWIHKKERSLAVLSPTIENTQAYGGHLPEGFYENLRATWPPEYVARYLDCSFEDFEGKVYKNYSLDSAHNLDHVNFGDDGEGWDFYLGIDPGGAAPWALVRIARDRLGRVVVYDECYKPNMAIREVASWIQQDKFWQKCQFFVIDSENVPVITELQVYFNNTAIQTARKNKMANIMRVNSYMQPHPAMPNLGSGVFGGPRLYFLHSCTHTRREHDMALWKQDETGRNIPDPKQPDHARDAVEYVLAALPPVEEMKFESKLERLRRTDPASAHFWECVRKKDRLQDDGGLFTLSDESTSPRQRGYPEDDGLLWGDF